MGVFPFFFVPAVDRIVVERRGRGRTTLRAITARQRCENFASGVSGCTVPDLSGWVLDRQLPNRQPGQRRLFSAAMSVSVDAGSYLAISCMTSAMTRKQVSALFSRF